MKKDKHSYRERYYACYRAWHTMKPFKKATLVVQGAAAGIVFIYTVVAVFQWCSIKRQADLTQQALNQAKTEWKQQSAITERQLKAVEGQLEAFKEANELNKRYQYLAFSPVIVFKDLARPMVLESGIEFSVTLENQGHGPAILRSGILMVEYTSIPPPLIQNQTVKTGAVTILVREQEEIRLEPGQPYVMSGTERFSGPVNLKRIQGFIESGGFITTVHGRVEYRNATEDTLENRDCMVFCKQYNMRSDKIRNCQDYRWTDCPRKHFPKSK